MTYPNKAIHYGIPVCLILLLVTVRARASMWTDPEWDQMVKDSDMIVLAEVIEGGKFIAKVRTLTVFKGTPPDQFHVTDYNNHWWPAEAVEAESYKKKQRYYLFLLRKKPIDSELLEAKERGGGKDAELSALREAQKNGSLWCVWTPSASDLPVEDQNVHYSLLATSYPQSAPARDQAEFERFLKAAISYHADHKRDAALLDETLQAIRKQSSGEIHSTDQESDLAHRVAMYFLLGGSAYDVAFEKIAAGGDNHARFMLARLLGGVTEERAGTLLLKMLDDKDSLVQGEVVRQLNKSNPEELGKILLMRLEGAGKAGAGPRGIMDPVRNLLDGGQIEIVRALGELKYQPAAPALIRLLESSNGGYGIRVILEALEKLGNHDYALALEKPLRDPKAFREIAEWVADHKLTQLKTAFEGLVENPPDAMMGGLHWTAIETLGKIGDEATGARLTAYLQRLTSREAPEVFDQGTIGSLIGALAELHYAPARAAVEDSIFYLLGVDSIFAQKPDLLKMKQQLESDLAREATTHFRDFRQVDAQSLVFLRNRRALADGSATRPEYSFLVAVNIRSPEHAELGADALAARLAKTYRGREGKGSVTRWNDSNPLVQRHLINSVGNGSKGGDSRVDSPLGSVFFYNYAHYVRAIHDRNDLRFVRFLLNSGLAKAWFANNELAAVFE